MKTITFAPGGEHEPVSAHLRMLPDRVVVLFEYATAVDEDGQAAGGIQRGATTGRIQSIEATSLDAAALSSLDVRADIAASIETAISESS